MVPTHRPYPEHEEQLMLLRRIDFVERQLSQQSIDHRAEISELRVLLRAQQENLARLLRVSG